MTELFSPYQLAILFTLCVWIIPLMAAWVRYDILPHSVLAFICIFFGPFILIDDILAAFDWLEKVPYAIFVFNFSPVLIAGLCFVSIRKMLFEKPGKPILHFGIIALFFAAQVPFLLLPASAKISLIEQPIVGNFLGNWMYYAFNLAVSIAVIVYAVLSSRTIQAYMSHLSEHTVDVSLYNFNTLRTTLAGLLAVGITVFFTILLVAFELVTISGWQTGIAILYSLIFCLVMMTVVERRRFAPCPMDYKELEDADYGEKHLQEVLGKAEKAIIKYKAYRKKGLQLRQVANAAQVEPLELAVASRSILNRNFRAFIYHYRLEYAKLLLTRTDMKVSTVAKRLGFDSEKYLSDIFVQYIQKMGRSVDTDMEEYD